MECLKQILDSASKGNFIKAHWNRQSVKIEFAVRFKKNAMYTWFFIIFKTLVLQIKIQSTFAH